jgi:SAM-dependent methyltransferase
MDIIEKNFNLYGDKTESDYWVKSGGNIIPTNTTILTNEEISEVTNFDGFVVYKRDFIDRLSPDNIDNEKFWKLATKNFPLFSIAGGVQNFTTIDEINFAANKLTLDLGSINHLSNLFAEKGVDVRMLEIGPGYGNILESLISKGWDKNYYAIDINPLFEHPRLFKSDGKNIPDTIPNPMDVVYSINVFQHLSKKQRTSYYKQIFEVLKENGTFVFGMFVETPLNKDWLCWGVKDDDDKKYCTFFKQLTEVDKIDDLYDELKTIGYSDIKQINPLVDKTNYLTFEVLK